MKRLGFSLLLSLAVFGSVAAQTGSKHVDLKEITDGKFRQVTAIGEMRSLPDGEHYTAMNADKSMIIKYSYRTGNPVDTLFNAVKLVNVPLRILMDIQSAAPGIISWFGGIRSLFIVALPRLWFMIMTYVVIM